MVVPLRIGRRLVIAPPGLDLPSDPESIPIRIDAGTAFGSGTHPTTQLCLQALERHLTSEASLLDLGTGTGILAIAAAKLGARPILALDIDSEAVGVARGNVALNQVGDRIHVEQGSLAEALAGKFGTVPARFVVANILAGALSDLFEQGLTRALAPGGWLGSLLQCTSMPNMVAMVM